MVKLEHVHYAYDESADGLQDVSLCVQDGEFVFITGKSGSGKSTLSKLITAELTADEGSVRVNNYSIDRNIRMRSIAELRRTIGMVFQDFRLINSMTVWDNLEFAMQCIKTSNAQIEQRIPEVLDLVGLTGKEYRFPNQLSGGEQQRVAIARAIINKPTLIIADEPTGNLDPSLAEDIFRLFLRINELGTTTIVITHAADMVQKLQRRTIGLKGGKVLFDITPKTESVVAK